MAIRTALTWTEYQRLPESDPYEHEMICGEEFVSPSPKWVHQRLAAQIWRLLDGFVRERNLGILVPPFDLHYDETNYVSPDLSFYTRQQMQQLEGSSFSEMPPPLVVEILSASSIKWGRENKRGFYKRFGVLEYWIIDPFEQTIEVIDLPADAASATDPAGSKVLPGFSVRWEELFSPEP